MAQSKRLTFVDVMEVKYKGSPSELTEISLSRVYQRYREGNFASFAILTAWRQGRDLMENQQAWKYLRNELRSRQVGFAHLIGSYEALDTEEMVTEPYFWAMGLPQKGALALGRKYGQSVLVYSGPETAGKVVAMDLLSGAVTDMGIFCPGRIAEAFSRMGGKRSTFTFECDIACFMDAITAKLYKDKNGQVEWKKMSELYPSSS